MHIIICNCRSIETTFHCKFTVRHYGASRRTSLRHNKLLFHIKFSHLHATLLILSSLHCFCISLLHASSTLTLHLLCPFYVFGFYIFRSSSLHSTPQQPLLPPMVQYHVTERIFTNMRSVHTQLPFCCSPLFARPPIPNFIRRTFLCKTVIIAVVHVLLRVFPPEPSRLTDRTILCEYFLLEIEWI